MHSWQAIKAGSLWLVGVMINRPTSIGVRGCHRRDAGRRVAGGRVPWSKMPRPRLWHGQCAEPERAVARQCALEGPGQPVCRRPGPAAPGIAAGLDVGAAAGRGRGLASVDAKLPVTLVVAHVQGHELLSRSDDVPSFYCVKRCAPPAARAPRRAGEPQGGS